MPVKDVKHQQTDEAVSSLIRLRAPQKQDQIRRQAHQSLARSIRHKLSKRIEQRTDLGPLIKYNVEVTNISENELFEQYLPDILPIERCLGDDLCHSRFRGIMAAPALEDHIELSLYLALRTIESLNGNPKWWGNLSGRPEDQVSRNSDDPEIKLDADAVSPGPDALSDLEETWRIEWLRTAFRCAMSVPIGYIVSHTMLRGSATGAPSWSPAAEDLSDYVHRFGPISFSQSGSVLAPKQLAFSVYLRLFERAGPDVPLLSLHEADFFRDKPNTYNPLYKAFHEAVNHIFYDELYARLPFWWCLLLDHDHVKDENYQPIGCTVPALGPDADKGLIWKTVVPEDKKTKAASKDAAPAEEEIDVPLPQPDRLLEFVRSQVENATFYANAGGAVFQGHNSHVYLVVPAFWQKVAELLNRPGVTSDDIHERFLQAALIDVESLDSPETTFEIRPANSTRRLGKIRSLPLSEKGVESLFPNGPPFGDNPDIRPLSLVATVTAA